MPTLADLTALYRDAAHDTAIPPACSDNEVYSFINEAEEEACIRANLLHDKTSSLCTIPVLANQAVYAADESILTVMHATLVDAGGVSSDLGITDYEEMDRVTPSWRTLTDKPTAIVQREGSIEFNRIPNAAYTLKLEVYRIPAETKTKFDTPEIQKVHHRRLLDWVLYRAYSKKDSEQYDPAKAAEFLAEFENYFGMRPTANMRKRQQENRPHRNKAYF